MSVLRMEDDEDLENLRLAALQSLQHKKVEPNHHNNLSYHNERSQITTTTNPSYASSHHFPGNRGYNQSSHHHHRAENNYSNQALRVPIMNEQPYVPMMPSIHWRDRNDYVPSVQLSPRSAAFVHENQEILMRRKGGNTPPEQHRWSPEPQMMIDRRWSRSPSPLQQQQQQRSRRNTKSPLSPVNVLKIRSPVKRSISPRSPRHAGKLPPRMANQARQNYFDGERQLYPNRSSAPVQSPKRRRSKSPVLDRHRKPPPITPDRRRSGDRGEDRRKRSPPSFQEIPRKQVAYENSNKREDRIEETKDSHKDTEEQEIKEIVNEKNKHEEDPESDDSSSSDEEDSSSSKSECGIDLFASEESESENEGRFKSASASKNKREEQPKASVVSFSKLGTSSSAVGGVLKELHDQGGGGRGGDRERTSRGDRFRRDDRRRDDRSKHLRDRRDDRGGRRNDRSREREKGHEDRDHDEKRNGKAHAAIGKKVESKFRSTFQTIEPDTSHKRERVEEKHPQKSTPTTSKKATKESSPVFVKEESKKTGSSVRMRLGGYARPEGAATFKGSSRGGGELPSGKSVISIVRKRPVVINDRHNKQEKEEQQKVTSKWRSEKVSVVEIIFILI